MTRISTGKHINHVTGVTTELPKEKPDLIAGQQRCYAKIEFIDAESGAAIETFEQIENVKKSVTDSLAALVSPSYTHYWGGDSTGGNTARVYEIHLLDDEAEVESQKYVMDEGTIVGYARLDGDYGGSDTMRGSRNQSLSGYHVDAATGNLVFEISFIWDETRMNGKRFNKIALSPVSSASHMYSNSSEYHLNRNDAPIFSGSSHRYLHDSDEGRGWTLQIKESILIDHWEAYSSKCTHLPSHVLAFGSMMMSPGRIWEDKEFELYTLDISNSPEDKLCYRENDIRKVTLPGVTELWRRGIDKEWAYFHSKDPAQQQLATAPMDYSYDAMTRDTWNYYYFRSPTADRSLDRIFFAAIIGDVLTVKTYRPMYDELGRIQTLPEVINTKTYTLDKPVLGVHDPIAVTLRDGNLEVFYPSGSGQVCITIDKDTDAIAEKLLGRSVRMSGATHVRDNVYMFSGGRNRFNDLQGGYIDFDTNGYIETFRYYPHDDTGSHYSAIYPMRRVTSSAAHPIYDVRTGRIYDIRKGEDNFTTGIAIPVDYVPPARYLHVDTFPAREKKPTEQIRLTYRIEYTGNPAAIELPFDHIHGAELNANVRMNMSHGNDIDVAKPERQEYRHLQQAVALKRSCPSLAAQPWYVDRGVEFYIYLLEREDGSFFFRFKHRPSPEIGYIETDHDIIGWNREIFDDTSDWRNQYLSISRPSSIFDNSYSFNYAPFSREDGMVAQRKIHNATHQVYDKVDLRFHSPDYGEAVDWLNMELLTERRGVDLDVANITGPSEPVQAGELLMRRNYWYYSDYIDGEGDRGGMLTIPTENELGVDGEQVIDLSGWTWDKTKFDLGIKPIDSGAFLSGGYASPTDDTDIGHFYNNASKGKKVRYIVGLCVKDKHGDIIMIEETRELHRFAEFTVKID